MQENFGLLIIMQPTEILESRRFGFRAPILRSRILLFDVCRVIYPTHPHTHTPNRITAGWSIFFAMLPVIFEVLLPLTDTAVLTPTPTLHACSFVQILMYLRCTNDRYPCRAGADDCINTTSFFVPQAVMTYANVNYDPTNDTTLINSLDMLWTKSNRCNRASPWFWLVRDSCDAMLVGGIALFALTQSPPASLCGRAREHHSVQHRFWSAGLVSSVALELVFLTMRLCADVLALFNNQLLFCCLGLAYFVETDLCVGKCSGVRASRCVASVRPCIPTHTCAAHRRYIVRLFTVLKSESIAIRKQRLKKWQSILAAASQNFSALRESDLVAPEFLVRLEDFSIDEEAGPFAMGHSSKVYRGRYGSYEVAIKEVTYSPSQRQPMVEFAREMYALSRLVHPGIVQLFGVCIHQDQRMFLLSEYCPVTLSRVVFAAAGQWDDDKRLNVAVQIAETMKHVHAHGLLHRDLKPANVLMGKDGQCKL